MATDGLTLQRTLRRNAGFSAVSGLALLVAAGFLAGALFRGLEGLFGFSMVTVLRIVGVAVVVFAGGVYLVSRYLVSRAGPRRGLVVAIIVADGAWVAASLALVVLAGDFLTPAGLAAVTAVSLVVAAFGMAEWRGLVRWGPDDR